MRREAVDRVLELVQVPAALMVIYLDVLAIAALCWRPSLAPVVQYRRFALLIPAHNEELLLPRLLRSLAGLSYARELFDIHVVADNCSDGTAELARAGGAVTHERADLQLQSKGHALAWLLARVAESAVHYDAFVILDADSVVSPDLLEVLNAHLSRGDQVVQAYYGVLNAGESWPSALRYGALALFNGLRPRGRDALGLSAGLRGNGMCLTAAVIRRFGWEAFSLAEDAELHLRLVSAGLRVTYAGSTTVLADMPTTLKQAHSQNLRWERGRLQMLRTYGPRLLLDALRRHDLARLDALAEQFVPPLSVLTGGSTCMVLLTAALRTRAAHRLARLVLVGQLGYVLTGLALVRAGPRIYLALLASPVYVLWKIWVYLAALGGTGPRGWVRTARGPAAR